MRAGKAVTAIAAVTTMMVAIAVIPLSSAWGAAKAKPAAGASSAQNAISGKRVLALDPVERVRIEMPDQTMRDFGEDFEARMVTRLTESGRFIVTGREEKSQSSIASLVSRLQMIAPDPAPSWSGSVESSATVRVYVDAMSFVSGARGGRSFYGFDEWSRKDAFENEFPLRSSIGNPSWFGRVFEVKGSYPFDSASGLDLGEGIDLNVLFAWLSMKYSGYRSRLVLRVEVDSPWGGRHDIRRIEVTGRGFFYDLVGAYGIYGAGIRIARTDAMNQAFQKALDAALESVERAVADLPSVARVDAILEDGSVLLGTGPDAGVAVGTRYFQADQADQKDGLALEITQSARDGSVARLISGSPKSLCLGQVFMQGRAPGGLTIGEDSRSVAQVSRSVASISAADLSVSSAGLATQNSAAQSIGTLASSSPILAASESIDLPAVDIPQSALGSAAPDEDWLTAWWKSLTGTAFLPYRLFRYSQYDQAYEKGSAPAGSGPIVAVLDSGVDYNHPRIRSALWLNPAPAQDSSGRMDRYGWDFTSGDSRPYDDAYHGTQMASLVLEQAPGARILPVKVFNPYGVTSSEALYSGIVYSVDRGARVILCGWATRIRSKALEAGILYARDHGAVIVTAAGDDGLDLGKFPSYPASFAAQYDNVLVAANISPRGEALAATHGVRSNLGGAFPIFGIQAVQKKVAEPRGGSSIESGSTIAAGILAGMIARRSSGLDSREIKDDLHNSAVPLRPGLDYLPLRD